MNNDLHSNDFACNLQIDRLQQFLQLGEAQFQYEKKLLLNNFEMIECIIKGLTPPPPFCVEVHPSGFCNNNCRWCRGESGKKTPDFSPCNMEKEALLNLVDQVKNIGSQRILFDGYYGEPLMNPATKEAMNKALEIGLEIALGTNGLLLNEEVREVIVKGKYVRISLDAGSNETHNLLKKTKGKPYDEIIKNLAELVKLKNEIKSEVRIGISFIIQSENICEIIDVAKTAKEIGCNLIQFKISMADPMGILTEEQLDEVFNLLEQTKQSYEDSLFNVVVVTSKKDAMKESSNRLRPDYTNCYANILMPVIGPDGNIYPCCEHSDNPGESFGSIYTKSFKDIMEGSQREKVMNSINPSVTCGFCSRYNNRINRFINFIADENKKEPHYLDWLKQIKTQIKE